MKYAIIIPDGCADWPIEELGGRTPLQAAATPNLDALARRGIVGRSNNVPQNFPAGSDVATLGLLGYDPATYYTGRAPLEAAAMGIELGSKHWAVRCNLVTLEDGVMRSFSAGHISTKEAAELLQTLNKGTSHGPLSREMQYYSGVSYRHLLTVKGLSEATQTFPPHDFTDKNIDRALPVGPGSDWLRTQMEKSRKIFETHPVNRARIADNKLPATQVWLWGQGLKPTMPPFSEHFSSILNGKAWKGAMITAVDLLRGIASLIGWDHIDVPGITGYVDTDFAAKGLYAAQALQNYDMVCVHVEAPDEAGHEGSVEKKIKALEDIDAQVVPPLLDALQSHGDWRLLVSPDHPTPIALKTHTSEFVPWLMVGSDIKNPTSQQYYDEETARNSAWRFDRGHEMMEHFLSDTVKRH